MEPVQPNQLSNTTRRYYPKPVDQKVDSRFSDAVTAASSHIERSSDEWELGGEASLDQYRQGLQKLIDDTLVDQALANTRIAILLSTLAVERMRDNPEFEGRVLNSLYNGMQAAIYLAVPAYLILRIPSDGTLETSSGDEETMPRYEEEKLRAFWTLEPVSASRSSTDSWRMKDRRKPKARRKLDRRRIRV